MSPYLTRSVLNAQQLPNAASQACLAPCARAAFNIKSASKPVAYRIEKHPAINLTLHHKKVTTVRKSVPASKNGPAIKFTLHLESVRTVKRYLPAQEVKIEISDQEVQNVKQQLKVENEK